MSYRTKNSVLYNLLIKYLTSHGTETEIISTLNNITGFGGYKKFTYVMRYTDSIGVIDGYGRELLISPRELGNYNINLTIFYKCINRKYNLHKILSC